MRLVHTSDWHLGHTLHELPRRAEHLAFFAWLLELLATERADALLVAGDVFDTANPSAEAQGDFYEFLAAARRRLPRLGIIVIGGNHDSASRLDAPVPILRGLGVDVVGGVARRDGGAIDIDRHLVAVLDANGRVGAHVVGMPFLRPADLPPIANEHADEHADDGIDALVEGVRRVYREAIAAAEARRQPGEAIVAMGHLYMTGTAISALSERKILGGNQHALPVDLFPESVAYVALGHLHLAQQVGRESVRYSGSPIALSFGEIGYRHQVVVVDLDGAALGAVRPVGIPRFVGLLQIPQDGPRPLAEVLALLAGLPPLAGSSREALPFLEVQVRLDRPEPGLRAAIDAAIEGKAVRLARIATQLTGTGAPLAEAAGTRALREITPEEVLRKRWARDHDEPMPDDVLAAFHELLDAAHQAQGTA
jgi:exonuclease SbcD